MSSPRAERVFVVAIVLAVLNTAYLSWRYLVLKAGCATVGTGLCSLTKGIDCDQVLSTPQARAFWFPNALLGFGFFFGCLVYWLAGQRLGPAYRHHVTRTLAFWLAVATLITFRFFWLLVHLAHFCPLCPWNHLLTYVSLGAMIVCWRASRPEPGARVGPLAALVAGSILPFAAILAAWFVAYDRGALAP